MLLFSYSVWFYPREHHLSIKSHLKSIVILPSPLSSAHAVVLSDFFLLLLVGSIKFTHPCIQSISVESKTMNLPCFIIKTSFEHFCESVTELLNREMRGHVTLFKNCFGTAEKKRVKTSVKFTPLIHPHYIGGDPQSNKQALHRCQPTFKASHWRETVMLHSLNDWHASCKTACHYGAFNLLVSFNSMLRQSWVVKPLISHGRFSQPQIEIAFMIKSLFFVVLLADGFPMVCAYVLTVLCIISTFVQCNCIFTYRKAAWISVYVYYSRAYWVVLVLMQGVIVYWSKHLNNAG